MVMGSFGGLRSCAIPCADLAVEKPENIEDVLRFPLDENLLSPDNSSAENTPVKGPPQTLFETALNYHNKKLNNAAPNQLANDDEKAWETVETTVTYGHGSKQTILASNVTINAVTGDVSCAERCWECFEHMMFRIICCNPSFRTDQSYRNMSNVFTKVDHVASRVFPLTFMIINVAYWALYIYIL